MSYATGSGQNADYNNQIAVPDFDDYFTRWRKQSEQLRASKPCILDVPYGPGGRQSCDIFPADAPKLAPVLVFIHGGWWYFLDKKDHSFIADPFLHAGCAVVFVGYPLAPAASISEIVRSVRSSLVWVYQNIARFGGDPERMHVAGHSAGGHLTAMMLTTDWAAHGVPGNLVKSGCPISGLFDLEDVLNVPQNRNFRLLPDVAVANSPLRYIPETAPPVIACVGGNETRGFHRQHDAFVNAWRAPSRPLIDASIPGENHFSIIEHLGNAESSLFKTFIDYVAA
jgi:arylformamidase